MKTYALRRVPIRHSSVKAPHAVVHPLPRFHPVPHQHAGPHIGDDLSVTVAAERPHHRRRVGGHADEGAFKQFPPCRGERQIIIEVDPLGFRVENVAVGVADLPLTNSVLTPNGRTEEVQKDYRLSATCLNEATRGFSSFPCIPQRIS
jgi:hypothetical protein